MGVAHECCVGRGDRRSSALSMLLGLALAGRGLTAASRRFGGSMRGPCATGGDGGGDWGVDVLQAIIHGAGAGGR